jgi:hypothetical protein
MVCSEALVPSIADACVEAVKPKDLTERTGVMGTTRDQLLHLRYVQPTAKNR